MKFFSFSLNVGYTMEDQPPWIQDLHFIRKVNNLDYIGFSIRNEVSIEGSFTYYPLLNQKFLLEIFPSERDILSWVGAWVHHHELRTAVYDCRT